MDCLSQVPVFEKAHARMKRIHITESIRKIAGQGRRRRRKSSLAYVFQVAFGLLLAFYNREKPIQSVDVPFL